METFFPRENQVTISDLMRKQWFDILPWNQRDIERLFSIVGRKGYISIDRQMEPWIIEKEVLRRFGYISGMIWLVRMR